MSTYDAKRRLLFGDGYDRDKCISKISQKDITVSLISDVSKNIDNCISHMDKFKSNVIDINDTDIEDDLR